jgi:hypothetical protein
MIARSLALKKLIMKNPTILRDPDGPEIEPLIKAVEEDGLPHSMAMGELLRALHGLSQTLTTHQTVAKQAVSAEVVSASDEKP